MLIEELIRLGRPVLESGLEPREVLTLITDAAEDRVKNFYRHVIVVELPPKRNAGEPAVLPIQNWQVEQQVVGKKQPVIDVDIERALGAPFVYPAGNRINAQGRYVPAYPLWEKHFQKICESAEEATKFLLTRLRKTPGFAVSQGGVEQIASKLHTLAKQSPGCEEWKGVVVLARCGAAEFYDYQVAKSRESIAESSLFPGRFIRPCDERILDGFWAAKIEEGAEFGRREGACTLTAKGDSAIAPYCKAWPWGLLEWTCPIRQGGGTRELLKKNRTLLAGFALSDASYRALTVGANMFRRLTRSLHYVVLPELFAPVENRDRQNAARNRRLSDLTQILGAAFLLPVQDTVLDEPNDRDTFARRLLAMLNAPAPNEPLADRYLTSVTGFNVFLPEELNRDHFRLTLVYFSGEVSRGDVHLRAYIQDVLPSTASRLKNLVRPCREQMAELLRALSPHRWQKILAYLNPRYQSVPYLLARAYGGSQFWTTLEKCLHRLALEDAPLVAHVTARIRSVVPCWPRTRSDIADEVIFLLVCRDFIHRYNQEVADPPKEAPMPMRPWQELIRAYEHDPMETMEFRSVAELGFACGLVVRRFSGWYYASQEKDYLKHRVLTFGTDLGAKDIQRGVITIRSVSAKFDDLRGMIEFGALAYYATKEERKQHAGDYQRRLGVVLNALNASSDIDKQRDEFISGFWSGYCLQGHDRPATPADAPVTTTGGKS